MIDTVKVRGRSCKSCTRPSGKAEVSAASSRPLKPGDLSYAPKNTMMMMIIIIYSDQQVSCHEDCSDLVLHDEVQKLGQGNGEDILRTLVLRKPVASKTTCLSGFTKNVLPSFPPGAPNVFQP